MLQTLYGDISNGEFAIIPNAGHLSNMEQPQPVSAHSHHFCASA